MSGNISVEFRGQQYNVPIAFADTLEDVGCRIAAATGTAFQTLKVLGGGRVIVPSKSPSQTASSTGLTVGARVRLLASTEGDVDAVRSSRDLPGLAGFDEEARRAGQRQRGSMSTASVLPSGLYTFADFKTWEAPGAVPGPDQALKLLHRLAADPGIIGIMRKHKWRVGLLSELPPEGKVGISPVCLLGLNVNAGQEIKLRLRTDDLQGFRRYQPIRETLVHELTHNVHGDHDNKFKTLNSQLLQEVRQYDAQSASGQTLGGETAPDGYSGPGVAGGHRPTVHRLGGVTSARDAAAAAAAAALQREADLVAQRASDIVGMGHRDAQTEAAEQELKRMGGSTLQQVSQQASPQPPLPSQSPSGSCQHANRMQASGSQQPFRADVSLQPPRGAAVPVQPSVAAADVDMSDAAAITELQPPTSRSDAAQQPTQPVVNCGAAPGLLSAPADSLPDAGPLQSQPAHQQPAEASASGAAKAAQGVPGSSDEVQQRYARMQQMVCSLVAHAPSPQQAHVALSTIGTILQNALNAPDDPKFRRVRQNNATFQKRTASLTEAVEILRMAGFVESTEQQQPVLVLQRNDPGLLWLSLSAVKAQRVH